jgi:putative GTP pyrophosphokinase
MVKAEIQIRTLAMDLWASLEHKLKYKSEYCTEDISKKLIDISSQLHVIDEEMLELVNMENKIKLLQESE